MMKSAASKKYRRQAKEAVDGVGVESFPWNKVSVKASFYFKTNRRHDEDNAIASLKAAYDGIVDAGVVSDDDHKHMSREKPEFFIDKSYPRVILYLERIK